jgi:hypothetical protein
MANVIRFGLVALLMVGGVARLATASTPARPEVSASTPAHAPPLPSGQQLLKGAIVRLARIRWLLLGGSGCSERKARPT